MTEARTQVWGEALSDAELITAVRGGDPSAYGALYERHAAAAHSVARQYVRSTVDADDVVSDAFARTLSVLQNGGGPDVTFRAYLFTVVRRLSYDLVNGARRTQPTDDERTFESAFGPMASTEDPTLEGFERSIVAKAYAELPERWRAVLWYTEVENLPPAEIAPILGLTANGVSALSYRAREGLRQAYLQQHLTSVPAEECQGVNPLLGSYVRGGLAKRETARVESHLDGCGECRGLVLELGDVSHGMRAVIAPLVLGIGALGLVGTALPVSGGAAVAGGAAAALAGAGAGQGASGGAAGSGGTASGGTAGSGGAAGTGGAAGAGGAATGGAGAVGGGGAAAGTGAAGSVVVGGGAAGTGVAAAGASAAGATVAAGGAGAAAAAGGLAALVASAPLAAAAVGVGVLAVAGLGVAGALGVFTPDDTPTPEPTAATSPSPSASPEPSGSATTEPSTAPTDPSTDPTSPTNIPTTDPTTPEAQPGEDAAPVTDVPAASPVDPGTTPVEPAPSPVVPAPAPVEPTPAPTDPPPPPPAPPALELSLGTVTLAARQPADLTVIASNTGGRDAEEVLVELTLPDGVATGSSSLVTGGASVAPAIRAAALPCGSAAPQADGTSLVTCSVGVLSPGASQELVVQVTAQSGGEYFFHGVARAKGVEPVRKAFKPTSVGYYGAEVRVAALYTEGRAFALTNPGTVDMALEVRNAGDKVARQPSVEFALPDGVVLVTEDDGAQRADGWTCRADDRSVVSCSTEAELAPKQRTSFAVDLLADAEDVDGARHTVTVSGDAAEAHDGATTVVLDVAEAWAGAEDGLTDPVVPRCGVPEDRERASIHAEYTNTTAYDDLTVTAEAAGSGASSVLARGETGELRVDDGVRFPAGSAALVLSTTIADETFEHRLDAGSFAALDCWDPTWLTAADVGVTAENVDGTVRYTADVVNDTDVAMDVRLLAPTGGTWDDVADSDAAKLSAEGGAGAMVLETGLRETPRGNAVLRQYRFHTDADGDSKGYQSLLPILLDEQRIAPAVAEPTVGQCVFDPATDTSSAPVALRYDNSASTLPVVFSVDGHAGVARTVPAGTSLDVDLPRAGAAPVSYTVRTDGARPVARGVPAVDCFVWSVGGSAASRWSAETGSVVVDGTFRNGHAVAPLSVVMDAGELGTTEAVEVAPGAEASFSVDTGSRDVAAGEVTFRVARLDGSETSREVSAAFAAVRYAPSAAAAPGVGECVFDPATDSSSAPVSLRFDNSASTVPAVFSVEGRDDVTVSVRGGAVRDVQVPGGVGSDATTLVVLADGAPLATHDVAGVDCFAWSVDGAVSSGWVVDAGTGSAVLTGTFRNDHRAATLRVVLDAGALGSTEPVEVAPGTTATLTIGTRLRDLPAGSATFRAERTDATGGTHDLTRSYDAFTYVPSWATTATVETRWQDGSVKIVGTLTNDSPETIDGRMLGGSFGDSAPVQKIAPGQSATFTVDTKSLDVKPGAVSFRQYRWVQDKGFQDTGLTARYGRAAYEPDWSATATVNARCTGDTVWLTASLHNDSAETVRVVATTPWGAHDLGDVAPGQAASADVDSGALSVKPGKVTFDLSRTHLGSTFTQALTVHVDAVDCAVVEPTVELVLGDAYYDESRAHSYRAVSALLDNSGSNVPVTFRVTGQGKGSWDLAAREVRTVELGEAPWSGASYVVHTDAGTQKLTVDPFSVAPQCATEWQRDVWYPHSATVSYGGLTYEARNGSIGIRPDRDLLRLFWERGTPCGEGGPGKG
ncbi:sigma-70 family RNA polymerase sigma factor [Cellulosimicrobium sp. Marseille-Q4280]|uniref:sigma-70 family RNA polymerase sigma factor n=1 Tax=Cellulosimicrobium sp. Marseille-Q4280 TaxID=2937992 RepID=UPI00203C061E|nr:sigma-70 family RNA polymerase sigma factor [Cellulosimicrobium sp. Marseille-Q4280]